MQSFSLRRSPGIPRESCSEEVAHGHARRLPVFRFRIFLPGDPWPPFPASLSEGTILPFNRIRQVGFTLSDPGAQANCGRVTPHLSDLPGYNQLGLEVPPLQRLGLLTLLRDLSRDQLHGVNCLFLVRLVPDFPVNFQTPLV
jgi:hypothetical protein